MLLQGANCAKKRPFFIIGHMVNSIHEVDRFLNRGANALEADVNFAPNGTVLETFHGFPCDCLRRCKEREDIADYLEYIRHVTSIRKQCTFLLLFFVF